MRRAPLEAGERVFSRAAFPQRLEAAADSVVVTARVELVPFPPVLERGSAMTVNGAEPRRHTSTLLTFEVEPFLSVQESDVFPQPARPLKRFN